MNGIFIGYPRPLFNATFAGSATRATVALVESFRRFANGLQRRSVEEAPAVMRVESVPLFGRTWGRWQNVWIFERRYMLYNGNAKVTGNLNSKHSSSWIPIYLDTFVTRIMARNHDILERMKLIY